MAAGTKPLPQWCGCVSPGAPKMRAISLGSFKSGSLCSNPSFATWSRTPSKLRESWLPVLAFKLLPLSLLVLAGPLMGSGARTCLGLATWSLFRAASLGVLALQIPAQRLFWTRVNCSAVDAFAALYSAALYALAIPITTIGSQQRHDQ